MAQTHSTDDLEREEALVGKRFAERYRIEELVGRGTMGVVYRARKEGVSRDLALKLLRRKHWNTTASRRFDREAEIIGRLKHPHTVELFDRGGTKDGDQFIVTDFLRGTTLSRFLAASRLPIDRLLLITGQICGSLIEAHKLGVVHRDLKPDNVFLIDGRDDHFVKVIDFGIARLITGPRFTQDGMVLGTPMYMSPEQVSGVDVDARSDIYSLGCMIYHMLAGQPPFVRKGPLETMLAQINETQSRIFQTGDLTGDSIDVELEDLAFEMMEKEPEQRPQTIEQVYDRIETMRQAVLYGPQTQET